jgi:predicted GNAT family N-acyltransferase
LIELRIVDSPADFEAALLVRKRVFVDEQGVSPQLEIDEHDLLSSDTAHVVALLDGQVVGAGRVRSVAANTAKLERIAVLSEHRGRGLGVALTRELEKLAQQRGLNHLTMNAQQSAIGFYKKLGYVALGAEFMEANIVHQKMEKILRRVS